MIASSMRRSTKAFFRTVPVCMASDSDDMVERWPIMMKYVGCKSIKLLDFTGI